MCAGDFELVTSNLFNGKVERVHLELPAAKSTIAS